MIEQTETSRKRLDGLRYLSRDIEKNPKFFIEEACIEHLLRCCRASIEHLEAIFFKEEKQYEINATTIDTKPGNKEAC